MATSGYAKLFSSLWGGSIYGKFEASAVFMVFLSLADYDGHVDMTPQGIAGTTGWPLDFIVKGIKDLEQPDAHSRSPAEDGRRIVLLDSHRDWGWNIVNFALYRDKLRSAERRRYLAEKQRERRARQQLSTTVNSVNPVNHSSSSSSSSESSSSHENKTTLSALVIPEWLDPELWEQWKKHRIALKSRMTPHAEHLFIAKLEGLQKRGFNPRALMETAIERGWKTVFEPKPENSRENTRTLSAVERVLAANERARANEAKPIIG